MCNLFCNIANHPRSNLLTTWFVARQVRMWMVKRVILLFHSFCSNVANQVACFCYLFYRRFKSVNNNKYINSKQCILTCPASRQIYSNWKEKKKRVQLPRPCLEHQQWPPSFVVLDDQYGRQICTCMSLSLYTDFSPLSLTPERIKKTKVLNYTLAKFSTNWRITRGNNRRSICTMASRYYYNHNPFRSFHFSFHI